MDVYRRGRRVHEYVSDVAMLPDGPSGEHRPRGAEPAVFAPLGVGSIDNAQLGAALRGEFAGDGPMFAEFQHRLILKAMNLEPRALTTAFRWARKEDLPGAVRVQPAAPAPVDGAGQGWATIELVLLAGLPAEVDMFAAGQVIADAVAGKAWPMRAEVGCMMVLPGAAGGRELMPAMMRLSPVPSIGTYFIKLRMTSASGRPDDDRVVEVAKQAWASALRSRLEIVFVRPEEFEIGFRAAARYLESQ
jgi:hypothetical protein